MRFLVSTKLDVASCCDEPQTSNDATLFPLAHILQFPTRVTEWITLRSNRKENQMTNEHETSEKSTQGHVSPRSDVDGQRVKTFTPTGPVWAKINTQSGDVVVRAGDGSDLKITLSAGTTKNAYLLEHADVVFDEANNVLSIHTLPRGNPFSSRGLRGGSKRSWFDFGSSDLDVLIEVPKGSSLEVKTMSGNTFLHGSLGSVKVKSMSGNVLARDSSASLDVQSASGDVNVGQVASLLRCKSASGDVACSSAAAKTEIHNASGDVTLCVEQPGKIQVRNVSGDVSVRVARGLAVDVTGDSVSGTMGSNIDLDAKGDGASDDEVIVIKVATVSGNIRIDTAA